ncbi:MAG: type I glutamate--ammonia ligase [Desulfobacterales bacterium]|nr:type I glutamate--ammonia ligase [Desulfobacterales bacterium]MDD4071018.1 type I glutamate--ammonia ligase [Desulfobacterales bacterium]MDD4391931.1 type I glutamate--ammonia ligase [Desulfobacterales bacterium]
MTPEQVLEMARTHGAKVVDIRFLDLPGVWQHFTVPISELTESSMEEGFGFDASSIRGWQPIHASDMIVIPDPSTARMDPFFEVPTLVLIGDIATPITMEPYSRDPRYIARKAERFLLNSGIGDTAYIGPEAEFFIFDDVRFESRQNGCFYEIDSVEGIWNSGRQESPNLGYKTRYKEGYFPVPPMDKFQDLRTEMMLTLQDLGIDVECQHHEVSTAGSSEIDIRFKPLVLMGDQLMWFKYVLKNVATRHNRTVTFMPKPIFDDNGSGMHIHISIWKDGYPLFAGNKYAGISQEALYGIGGILKHCKALCAFTNPTTNSYKRLVPGFEAPVNLAYSGRNRSAAIRLPMYSSSPKSKRIEFRTPDPACNGYLAFSAILMAVIDGIENKIDPGDPMDKDIYNLPPEELSVIPTTPPSLEAALQALKEDNAFLKKGDVFTQDVIDMWIEYKTKSEINPVKLRPHPHEFFLYYDI